MRRALPIVWAVSTLAGCSLSPVKLAGKPPTAASATPTSARPGRIPRPAEKSGCDYRRFPDGAFGADPRCTPGALNPAAVADPGRTICRGRYLSELEVAEAPVESLKSQMMIRYRSAGNPSTYVLAQVIPAEDGGSPTDLKNLWPMPLEGWGGALTEAAVAYSLHERICRGRVSVTQAARLLEGDWLRGGIPDDD